MYTHLFPHLPLSKCSFTSSRATIAFKAAGAKDPLNTRISWSVVLKDLFLNHDTSVLAVTLPSPMNLEKNSTPLDQLFPAK